MAVSRQLPADDPPGEEADMSAQDDLRQLLASREIRQLDITDLERIERFRRAGCGGAVSDVL